MHKSLLVLLFGLFAMTVLEVARAEPPSHAPAHGWRNKNDATYVG